MTLCTGESLRSYLEGGIGGAVPADAQFIGKSRDGVPVSVCAFWDWTAHEVEISIWSCRPLSRDFLRRLNHYAFTELKCQRVTCRTAADRVAWCGQIERVGFVREGTMRLAFDGVRDLAVFGLLRGEFNYEKG